MAESVTECLPGHRSIVGGVRLMGKSEAEETMGEEELRVGGGSYLRTPGMTLDL
jgi:hypothetical protein